MKNTFPSLFWKWPPVSPLFLFRRHMEASGGPASPYSKSLKVKPTVGVVSLWVGKEYLFANPWNSDVTRSKANRDVVRTSRQLTGFILVSSESTHNLSPSTNLSDRPTGQWAVTSAGVELLCLQTQWINHLLSLQQLDLFHSPGCDWWWSLVDIQGRKDVQILTCPDGNFPGVLGSEAGLLCMPQDLSIISSVQAPPNPSFLNS